ncbi:NAD-specific glutamate dehydrogenase domain protein [Halococcus hamelinensis 100A6]|uniref:NAD-specific glutamate dehydrogenase domain protein n=1 Tax=Halococcus hamelinensis 100A6 TaxID=1132509 RepID=M0M8A3_9EURY|nr:NAD-specific glutamate dehydrogenase domain protein [Halococcus hamelinensis 100A6]
MIRQRRSGSRWGFENAGRGSGLAVVVFVVRYILEVGVDVLVVVRVTLAAHVAHAAGTRTGRTRTAGTASGLLGGLLLLVHLLADLLELGREVLGRVFELLGARVLVLEDFLDLADGVLDILTKIVVDLLFVLLEERVRALDGALGVVARLDALAALFVLLRVLFGLVLHPVDLVVRETRTALDGDVLGVARALVLGRDVHDAVLVDVERDLDLRGARGRRRDPCESELTQEFVLVGDLALALEHSDLDLGLVRGGRGEDLRLLGRDGRVLVDEPLEEAALDLDTERERGDVEQHDVVDVAREHAALDRRAQRDGLVGVDVLLGLLVDELRDLLLDLRHPGRTADEDDLVDVAGVVARVRERLLGRFDGSLDQVRGERLELRTRELLFEVDRARIRRRDEREVDRGLLPVGEFDLGLLGGVLQALEGLSVLPEVEAVVGFELLGEPVDDRLVPVVATEVVVAVGRDDLVDAAAQIENRDVERPPTEVVDHHRLVGLVVEAVGHRGRRRLVDDPLDVEARDLAGVLRGLALAIGEVRGNRDDRLLDLVAEVLLGVAFDLAEDQRRDLLGRVALAVDVDLVVLAHVALDRVDRAVRVLDRLVLRRFADQPLVVGEGHYRRRGAVALAVDDYLGVATLHHRERAVRRSQIDTEDLVARHCWEPLSVSAG